MSFIGGGMALNAGPGGSLRFSQTRGRIGGGAMAGVNYPSPFFDIAHTYLPITVKSMFRWCRYYFLTNPIINSVVFKLSEYPITDFVVDHPSKEVVNRWTEYFQDHLRYRPFQIECGLDYFTFGNCLATLSFPFKKYLICSNCKFSEEAKKIRPYWIFTNYEFRMHCPKCGHHAPAVAKDWYFKNASGIRMMRWNPEDVEIQYSELTGEYTYFYNIPNSIRNDVLIGKKEAVENVPQVFMQALRQQKGVTFNKDMFFHLKRPTLADQDRGWGIPLLLPVMKDTFYMQVMKKAQEAILLEHIVPLRILFPQPGSGTSDPYTTINLVDWRDHVATEIARWRMDNNYIPIMPLPLGNQTIGGDGRALLLVQEMIAMGEQLINGMQVPIEFIKGGMSYAGTNVSMRMLENQFIGYLSRHKQMANWVMKEVAAYMDWPEAKIRFKPFKMADDIQRKAYLFQLNQAGKISDTTLLADADLNQEEEDEIMERETASRVRATEKQQLALAELQGKSQIVMMKMTAKAQQEMNTAMMAPTAPGEPGSPEGAAPVDPMAAAGSPLNAGQDMGMNNGPQPGQQPMMGGSDIVTVASGLAGQLLPLDPASQHVAIQNIRKQSPELADLVIQFLTSMGGAQRQQQQGQNAAGAAPGLGANGAAAVEVNMKPLPEQRSPRRVATAV
jgi:hypothetical protein